jgi:ATP-dependent DNA helicase UvrD/PcrA
VHPEVTARLARLDPEQRAAATAPPGPVLCVAPAGSGKTTTLVARVAWLVDGGADPGSICVVAFNKRAAEELEARLAAVLEPLASAGASVRVRTFHALGREILRDSGVAVEPLVDRDRLLRDLFPASTPSDRARLDLAFSRLKLDLGVTVEDVAADAEPGPLGTAFLEYEGAIRDRGGLDFDDLVIRALRLLRAESSVLSRWRARCRELLVDEAQDLDRCQLELALLLAAPANHAFFVGDDDQSIYGWRLADVRRVLGLAELLPGLRRVDLETNYRCPRPVVERSIRLIERNAERFVKLIRAREGATGHLVLAPDASDDAERIGRAFDTWPAGGVAADGSTCALLTRTNRELLPGIAVALERELPFRAPKVPMLLEHPDLDRLLAAAERRDADEPLLVRLGAILVDAIADDGSSDEAASDDDARTRTTGEVSAPDAWPAVHAGRGSETGPTSDDGPPSEAEQAATRVELAAGLLAWAAPYGDLETFAAAVRERRERLARLRRDDAPLTFATAHSTKGLEFDDVVVLMDASRFPSPRALGDALEPGRALEEERRLAYVAWTRARRSLTLLYDPADPSPFLFDAFTPDELSG